MKKKKHELKNYMHRARTTLKDLNRTKRLAKLYGFTYANWIRQACLRYVPEQLRGKK